ncbi:MAG: hypothetical protein JW803_04115 [Endomicrobiales bacterium]|nr:hypothetical protein [Endomicrobiales bacterium]
MRTVILGLFVAFFYFALSFQPKTTPRTHKETIDLSDKYAHNLSKEQLAEIGLEDGLGSIEVHRPMRFDLDSKKYEKKISEFSGVFSAALSYLRDNENAVKERFLFFLGGFAVFSLVLYAVRQYSFLRALLDLSFAASSLLLILTSIICAAFSFASNADLWSYGGHLLYWFPAGILAVCSVAFRFFDPNFPVWRTLYKSFFFPLLSVALVSFKNIL